jgi:hypothetical protein
MSEIGKIYSLIPEIMADIGAIGKGQKNADQGYRFRGIDDMYNAVQPALIKHGVFCVPTILETTVTDRMTKKGTPMIHVMHKIQYSFFADDSSHIDAIVTGEAMDSSDKASNKAMSAAMKYAIVQVFCIPTEGDNDTENHTPEVGEKPVAVKSDLDLVMLKSAHGIAHITKTYKTAALAIADLSISRTVQPEAETFIRSLFEAKNDNP